VMIVTNGGMLIRMKVKEISVIGRNTQGVRLIALENGEEKVMAISKLPEGEESEEETEGGDAGAPVDAAAGGSSDAASAVEASSDATPFDDAAEASGEAGPASSDDEPGSEG
ncbi:MAG: DNA gyrase subunit A, partial [Myxococcaceae bacterium]